MENFTYAIASASFPHSNMTTSTTT